MVFLASMSSSGMCRCSDNLLHSHLMVSRAVRQLITVKSVLKAVAPQLALPVTHGVCSGSTPCSPTSNKGSLELCCFKLKRTKSSQTSSQQGCQGDRPERPSPRNGDGGLSTGMETSPWKWSLGVNKIPKQTSIIYKTSDRKDTRFCIINYTFYVVIFRENIAQDDRNDCWQCSF